MFFGGNGARTGSEPAATIIVHHSRSGGGRAGSTRHTGAPPTQGAAPPSPRPAQRSQSDTQSRAARSARAEKLYAVARAWAEASPLESLYNGTLRRLARAPPDLSSGAHGWARFIDKLLYDTGAESGRPLTFAVLGGSNSFGNTYARCFGNLMPGESRRQGTYYHELFFSFLEQLTAAVNRTAEFINLARGGADSCYFAPIASVVLARRVDIALLEFAVNDRPADPACLETIVRTILRSSPDAAILNIELQLPLEHIPGTHAVHSGVASHYRYAQLSLGPSSQFTAREGVFWNETLVNSNWCRTGHANDGNPMYPFQLFSHSAHISIWGHRLIADRLAWFVTDLIGSRSSTIPPPKHLNSSLEPAACYYTGLYNMPDGFHSLSREFNSNCFALDKDKSLPGNTLEAYLGLAHPRNDSCAHAQWTRHQSLLKRRGGAWFVDPAALMHEAARGKSVQEYRLSLCKTADRERVDHSKCLWVPFLSRKRSREWSYYGEGAWAAKFGWITTSPGQTIEFDMPLDVYKPGYLIVLGYMRSYEHMNTFTVTVRPVPVSGKTHDTEKRIELDGLWKQHRSVYQEATVVVAHGPCVLVVRSGSRDAKAKVKLISIHAQRLLPHRDSAGGG